MNYLSLEKDREKSSIAWFKLTEVIMRGEKERVLTMYRLLMHSLPNEPLRIQLEADILRVFGDKSGALDCYIKAAEIYSKNNELAQAISLYKIMIDLEPNLYSHTTRLIELKEAISQNWWHDTSFYQSSANNGMSY